MKTVTSPFLNSHGSEERLRQSIPTSGVYVYLGLVIASFMYYLWIASQIPYTHDDWDWGIQIGLKHLISADINSRYAGNFVVVILTRSVFLKDLVMGVVFTMMPVLSTELVLFALKRERAEEIRVRICLFSFANIILLGLPSDVWRQTYGWVAGFSNYVVSGLLLLSFLMLVLRQWTAERKGNCIISCVLAALFGVVIQLFLENLAVFFLLTTALLTIFFEKEKKGNRVMRALLLGTILGVLIVFSSDVFKTLWNTGYAVNSYRELKYDRSRPFYVFLIYSVMRFAGVFVPLILGTNGLLATSVSLLLGICVTKRMRSESCSRRKRILYLLLFVLDLVFSAYYCYRYIRGRFLDRGIMIAILNCVFACVALFEVFLLFRQDRRMLLFLSFTWLAPFVIMTPMLAVTYVGPRICFPAYLCLILFCQLLLVSILRDRSELLRCATATSILLLLAFGLHIGIVYDSIGRINRQRIEIMRRGIAAQSESICLPAYPYSQYLWIPNPANDEREMFFREFYHLPENMSLIFENVER